MALEVSVRLSHVRQFLIIMLSFVISAGFWAAAHDTPEVTYDRSRWVPFLSLSWEQNLPTWVSSLLLYSSGILLLLNGVRAREARSRHAVHWWGLAGIFLYISLDEFTTIHEKANAWFDFGGALYFGWVLPAFTVVTIIGVSCIGFLRDLPRPIARRFVLAGAIYVGGALGVELILGYWTDLHGSHNAVYGLIDLVEESMELMGVSIFLFALLQHLGGDGNVLRLILPSNDPTRAGTTQLE